MTKHIHVHLHRATVADNEWEESKHPRDAIGQFGSGSGRGAHGGNAETAQEKADREQREKRSASLTAVREMVKEHKAKQDAGSGGASHEHVQQRLAVLTARAKSLAGRTDAAGKAAYKQAEAARRAMSERNERHKAASRAGGELTKGSAGSGSPLNSAMSDAAQTARAQAKRAASTKEAELLGKKADLHDRLAKDGDDAEAKAELVKLNAEIGAERSRAQMEGGDLDHMRAAIRKERGADISIPDLNAEIKKRLSKK